jgi:hypothetical protein
MMPPNHSPETWSPFQSPQVRNICEHMTDAELFIARQRASRYGLWVAATFFAGPFGFAVGLPGALAWSVSGLLIVIHLACIPIWLQMQRRFLSSTIWAKEQGMKPEGLTLFSLYHRAA